eukprot:1509195-Pyramimonas_sp.AAC.1
MRFKQREPTPGQERLVIGESHMGKRMLTKIMSGVGAVTSSCSYFTDLRKGPVQNEVEQRRRQGVALPRSPVNVEGAAISPVP